MMLAMLALGGCDAINKAKDTLDGLLDPVVVEGIVLGVEPPESQELQDLLTGTDFESGTTATVFMADATDANDLENAPITGATVSLAGPGLDVSFTEVDAGLYLFTPADGNAPYVPGDTWTLEVGRTEGDSSQESSAVLLLPDAVDFGDALPEQHTPNTAIELDFTPYQGAYDGVLVVVVDDEGNVTYSNEPQTIREIYDFTHGSGAPATITIPAEAFPDEGIFAVGVAGMANTDASDLTEMNTALSSVVMGLMKTYPVSTYTLPPI